jgi:HlyD family secretion protein
MRRRLVGELGLSAAQAEQVDAMLAAAAPRFAELRNLAEDERPKARERILADVRSQVGEVLTAEQRNRYQALVAEMSGRAATRGRIYLLGDDGKPRAYSVRLGISDGVATELLVPAGSSDAAVLVEGAAVITSVIAPPAASRGAANGPRMGMPF